MVENDMLHPWEPGILSLWVYAFLVFLLIGALLFLSSWLGEKKPSAEKRRAYECGIVPTGDARLSYPVPFYLVATFFLIFDVEAAFIFAWAVAFDRLGWFGWIEISFFILILFVSLLYLWLKGGLEWGSTASKHAAMPETSSSPSSMT
jgi:NADH-quinone oxidoreductase subunit A